MEVVIFKITGDIKFKYDFSLKEQIRKTAISIPSNIAEGFERDNNNEFIHFLRIAKGSCAELITQVEIACETNFLTKEISQSIISRLEILNSRIAKFLNYLTKNRLTRKQGNQ